MKFTAGRAIFGNATFGSATFGIESFSDAAPSEPSFAIVSARQPTNCNIMAMTSIKAPAPTQRSASIGMILVVLSAASRGDAASRGIPPSGKEYGRCSL